MNSPAFWYLVSFVIFVGVMAKPLRKIFLKFLADKKAQIQEDLTDAATLKKEAKELLVAAQKKEKDAQKTAKEIIKFAEDEVLRVQETAHAETETFFANQEKQLKERIQHMEQTAIQEINNQMVKVAFKTARHVIGTVIDESKDAETITGSLKKLSKL